MLDRWCSKLRKASHFDLRPQVH